MILLEVAAEAREPVAAFSEALRVLEEAAAELCAKIFYRAMQAVAVVASVHFGLLPAQAVVAVG